MSSIGGYIFISPFWLWTLHYSHNQLFFQKSYPLPPPPPPEPLKDHVWQRRKERVTIGNSFDRNKASSSRVRAVNGLTQQLRHAKHECASPQTAPSFQRTAIHCRHAITLFSYWVETNSKKPWRCKPSLRRKKTDPSARFPPPALRWQTTERQGTPGQPRATFRSFTSASKRVWSPKRTRARAVVGRPDRRPRWLKGTKAEKERRRVVREASVKRLSTAWWGS